MDNLSPFITHALVVTSQYRYALLFIGTVIEGPLLMVACGFLLRLGVFSPVPMFVALAAGDLVGDVGWYFAGKYLLDPFMRTRGRFLSVTPEVVARVKKLFHRYHDRILFISKVTVGFGMALGVLMVAGASRVPFRRYMAINFLGELVFVTTMLLLGYLFGNAYATIAGAFRWAVVGGAVVVALGVTYGISRYARHKLLDV